MDKTVEKRKKRPWEVPSNLRRCPAMIEADIANPNNQKGKDFCLEQCPYPECLLFENSEYSR